jgi:hypothetical protein
MYRNAVVPTYETILGLLVIGGPKKIEQVIDATLRHLEPGVEISQNKIPLSKDSYDGGEGMTGDEVDSTSEMDVDRRAKSHFSEDLSCLGHLRKRPLRQGLKRQWRRPDYRRSGFLQLTLCSLIGFGSR